MEICSLTWPWGVSAGSCRLRGQPEQWHVCSRNIHSASWGPWSGFKPGSRVNDRAPKFICHGDQRGCHRGTCTHFKWFTIWLNVLHRLLYPKLAKFKNSFRYRHRSWQSCSAGSLSNAELYQGSQSRSDKSKPKRERSYSPGCLC